MKRSFSGVRNLGAVARGGSVDLHTDTVLIALNQVANGKLIGCIVADVTDDVAEISTEKKPIFTHFYLGKSLI